MAIKVKAGEHLDNENITKVISMLEEGCTKKVACEMLNISYNTTRLQKILDDFTETNTRNKELRAKIRKTPITDSDVSYIITEYLSGSTYTEIEESTFRSIAKKN